MLNNGDGTFAAGHDLPQLGYQNPASATRVTMAVGDVTADGRPELLITDPSPGGDRLSGNAGQDKLRAERGNDTIAPGAGKDTVAAGGGDDTITARDRTRDTIDCGAGRDKVKADRSDAVKNCEFVTRRYARRRQTWLPRSSSWTPRSPITDDNAERARICGPSRCTDQLGDC
jgi:Ca2+-binding RTX toxin-like protein